MDQGLVCAGGEDRRGGKDRWEWAAGLAEEQDEAVTPAPWLSELLLPSVPESLSQQWWQRQPGSAGPALSLGCFPAPKCLLSSAICLLYPCLELTQLQEVAVQINLDAARGLVIIKDWGEYWKSALLDCKNSENSVCKKWLEHAVWQMCSFCCWNLSIECWW